VFRLTPWLLAIPLLLCTGITPARAQTPSSNGFQTITSRGYQFQVPAGWQQLPAAVVPRSLEILVASADGNETVATGSARAEGTTAGALPELVSSLVSSINETTSPGGSAASVFQGPDPVQIANADAAVDLRATFTDSHGTPYVLAVRVGTRGQTVYFFVLAGPQDFYHFDPSFGRILDSFQLTPLVQGGAASEAFTGAPVFGLSPEEAIIALLPYRLTAQDRLPGYAAGDAFSPETAVTSALVRSSPAERLAAYQNAGFVVRRSQRLVPAAPPAAIPGANGVFHTLLFADQPSAATYADGRALPPTSIGDLDSQPFALGAGGGGVKPTTVTRRIYDFQPVALGAALGDASAAWRETETQLGQPTQVYYLLRWQLGQLVFELVSAPQPLGQERQADAESAASAIDRIERSRPALSLAPATVTPPATEAQRLQAAIRLAPFFVLAPEGYGLTDAYFSHPTSVVELDPDPAAALHRVDEQWKMVMSAHQHFTSSLDDRVALGAIATLCADAPGALTDMADELVDPGWTSTRIDPPVQLGDATMAFRDAGPNADGSAEQDISIDWTHGALLLHVGMSGPAGGSSMDQLAAFARQVEARFQANPLPTSFTP